ncbi:AAA family ATPase [Cytophagaceae bacterium YF14B1]|uniref:AAA family ATPase n=1 Tax=Xanthocytophaga flava TaxID=3048013 RepID=A0AAE3U633_9BACT|nr:AAA family ATPase [Xanthocytophaga flavus]MDJ1470019.1 AAA family ATPase [Xanthocytophaga flavus]MDJ1481439.1 AAA family ATPase [Xanthocytophaga flavus]
MQQVLILTGISGSGKSTFAKQFVQDNPNWLRINRDDLRKSILTVSLNDYWTWDVKAINRIEMLVNELQETAIQKALDRGWNVLIDNTHIRQKYINELVNVISNYKVEIRFKLIEISLEEAIERDKQRLDVVGERIIREQYEKLRILKKNFNFDKVITPQPEITITLEQDESLPKCVLVDIDGTVAKMNGRMAYDWKRVGEDLPKWNVINVVKSLKNHGYHIIFFSGRDGICHNETSAWITQYFDWTEKEHFQLFLRTPKDQRKDSIVKKEMFETYIRNKYFVEMVIDDRDQVVAMWRKDLGLTCLQVDYGNF